MFTQFKNIFVITDFSPYEKLMMEISGAGDKLVVIDFCVTWTKSCKKMESKVKELSKEEPKDQNETNVVNMF